MSDPLSSHGDLFDRSGEPLKARIRAWVGEQLWVKKLYSPLGLALLLAATLPVSYLLAHLDVKVGVPLFLALILMPLAAFCLFDTVFAVGMILLVASLVPFALKFTTAPIGTLLDLLILLSTLGILLRQIRHRDWSFLKGPLATMTLIWLYYNILQVLNPWADSKMAWLYTVRSVAVQQVVFFIAVYAFRNNRRAIMLLLKGLLFLGFVYAAYGLKQEFVGLSSWEETWLYSDPKRFELMFQWGRLRIASLCGDPTTFGILMAGFSMFCLALLLGPTRELQKIVLGALMVMALWSMAYSGTRTAFMLVPIGGIFYCGLILNKRVLLIGGFLFLAGTAFVLKSTSNPVIYRIKSAFNVENDDSMNVRLINQRKIQPYIQTHPFGGGLGSCGVWGERFSPGSELSQFPHDSSFVRMGVELGWIGLILYTLLHYFVLRTGLYYFVRCRDPLIKAIYAGLTTWCFMLTVACYVQEAIIQLPTNIIYNIMVAMLVTLKNFDPAFRQQTPETADRLTD